MTSADKKAPESRRELKSRNTTWARTIAMALAKSNISPNQISVLSIVFAALALAAFVLARDNHWYLILAVAGIQLRLLCNLMDGLVAIEFNKKSKVGDLYNEVPDRIGDAIIIIGAGLYCQNHDFAMQIAWANVFLATMTAYIRVLGASLGQGHKFLGPMAKQHRMALITAATLLEAFLQSDLIYVALIVMLIGTSITIWRRLSGIARALEEKT
ncbi:MAG: CDP-alcohol phosphatidyltransferase family protein [Bdellovibrio sp.]